MTEVKNIAKGETLLNVSDLMSYERRLEDQQQTIGALKTQVDNLKKSQVKELEYVKDAHKAEVNDLLEKQKVVKVIKGNENDDTRITCRYCGTKNDSYRAGGSCTWCGRALEHSNKTTAGIEYKNLDDVKELIRKEESKKLKFDLHKFEQQIEDLKLEKDKLYKENGRFKKERDNEKFEHAQNLAEVRKEWGDTLRKQTKAKDDQIEELEKEIEALKNKMTDEIIEENRKQEIIDLKTRIDELEKEIAEVEDAAATRRGFRAWFEKKQSERLVKEAIKEQDEKRDRINEISNNYPSYDKSSWNYIKIGDKKVRNPFKTVSNKLDSSWNYITNWMSY